MYQAFRELGKTWARMDGRNDPRELLLDPLGPGYDRCVVLVFDEHGDYLRVDSRAFSPEEAARIRYKDASGPSASTRPLPIIKQSGKSEETVKRLLRTAAEIGPWLKARGELSWGEWAERVGAHLEDPTRIVEEATAASNHLTVKRTRTTEPHNVFLTLGRERLGRVQWMLDEVPELLDRALEGIRKKYGKNKRPDDVVATDIPCQVCGRRDVEVFGNFNEIKCYNLDKPGMITGGFGSRRPVRNVPICLACAGEINYGFAKAQEFLKFRAAGSHYLLLPRTAEDTIREAYLEMALEARDTERARARAAGVAVAGARSGITLRKHTLLRLTDDEHEILGLIADEFGDQALLTLQMVFLHAGQAAEWKIKADIDEVLPSRLRAVFEAKVRVESDPWLQNRDKPITVTTRRVREFCHQGQEFAYLKVLAAIFRGGVLDRDVVIHDVVDRILLTYKKTKDSLGGLSGHMVAGAYAYLKFLEALEIIPRPEVIPMQHDATMNPYRAYLEAHADTFASPDRRAAFLTGALVNILLNVQKKERGATPFFNKLRGLKLSREHLQDLLPEVQNKLEQYGKSGFANDIKELLSHEWVAATPTWSISDSEATFFFVLGMNLQYHIAKGHEDEDTNDKHQED